MPQPRSSRFDRAQRAPHVGIRRNDLVTGDGQIIQRDIPTLPTGMVTADRLSKSEHLTRDVEFFRAALSEQARYALEQDLADVFLQSWAGIRYLDTEMVGGYHHSEATWTGERIGVVVGENGWLTLPD